MVEFYVKRRDASISIPFLHQKGGGIKAQGTCSSPRTDLLHVP